MADPKICIGFGEHEDICDRPAGTPWTPLWCDRCDALRREKLTVQFAAISESMNVEQGGGDVPA